MSLKPCTLQFKIDGYASDTFESLPWISDDESDVHENEWQLYLPAVTSSDEDNEEGYIGVEMYLQNVGEESVCTVFCFIVRDSFGKVFYEVTLGEHMMDEDEEWGPSEFVTRSEILNPKNNVLAKGALLIDVNIQYKLKENSFYTQPSSLACKMLELLEKGEGADVSFKVGDTTVSAHKLILKMSSSILFECCEENDGGSPIPLDVDKGIFNIMLRFIYAEKVPERFEIFCNGKHILEAADRFGLVGLKMRVEATLAEELVLTGDNVAEWLIFADAKTCPLLKEKAAAYFVSRSADILNSESSQQLRESPKLLTELMLELSRNTNIDERIDSVADATVDELRRQLHEKGLDVDGSKETLFSRLRLAKMKTEQLRRCVCGRPY